jgi:hypothetical protein
MNGAMRTFDDDNGRRWQAALLNASYGNIVLVFSPLAGDDIRQQLLRAENLAEGETQLAALDEAGLRTMLAEADPWDPVSGGF